MQPKPTHLERRYADVFQDLSVAQAYANRAPYPAGLFAALEGLLREPRTILDAGCGTGDIARRLSLAAERIDAVDVSANMIEAGRRQPGGSGHRLRWIVGAIEEAPLDGPYGLITAGESVAWFDWEIVFARFAEVLAPDAVLALVTRVPAGAEEWLFAEASPVFAKYSTNREFRSINLIDELISRGLFTVDGHESIHPQRWTPTIAAWIDGQHSRNGCSRERMGDAAAMFDAELGSVIERVASKGLVNIRDGRLQLAAGASVWWGLPRGPA